MSQHLTQISVDEIAFVDVGAGGDENARPKILITKRHKDVTAKGAQEVPATISKGELMTFDDILAALADDDQRATVLAAIEAAREAGMAAAETAKASDEDPEVEKEGDEEEDEKTLPASVQKRLQEAVELRKRLDALESDRERETFAKRAAAFPSFLGYSTSDLGELIRNVSKSLSAEAATKLEQSLSAVEAIVSKSALFSPAGAPGATPSGSAHGRATAIAKSLRDANPALTQEQAIAKAYETDESLYADYIAEQGN